MGARAMSPTQWESGILWVRSREMLSGKGSEVLMFIFMALPTEASLAFKTKQDPREFEWQEVSIRWVRLPQPDRGKRVDG